MEKENTKLSRMIYVDILNILAIISVIALHCNGIVHTYTPGRAWKTSLIVETVFFWAVPVFLMISGATLMNYRKKYDTKTFFKKRFTRVLVPAIFWITVMIIWKYNIGALNVEFSLKSILNIIFTNQEEGIYYYIFAILGIYLTMPMLSLLTEDKHRKTLWYIVGMYFIFNSTLPVICSIFGISYNNDLSIRIDGYLIFIILGYLLSTQDVKKKHRIIVYILGILSVIFRYVMTYYWSTKAQFLNRTLFDYKQFHSILLACAVFLFFKNLNYDKIQNKPKIIELLKQISSCSFGIYLIHMVVVHYELKLFSINNYSWEWRTIGIITTYLISLAIVYILKKIPVVRRVVS